jgi:hypothetical protein
MRYASATDGAFVPRFARDECELVHKRGHRDLTAFMMCSEFPTIGQALRNRSATKPFSPSDEIETKQTICSVATVGWRLRVGPELVVKTFIFLSLAFVLAASVAVIATTSSPSGTRTESSAAYVY